MRLIDADALKKWLETNKANVNPLDYNTKATYAECITMVEISETIEAIPIDTVAEMLAELFGEECCCNYNGIDEWLPMLCEHSETCPEAIGKNGCWKQFIKHWEERKCEDAQID